VTRSPPIGKSILVGRYKKEKEKGKETSRKLSGTERELHG